MLTISFSLANSQCWSCSDELPPPAELRGRAAHHHPLPGCLYLEVSWGSACWTGVCEIQGLEWGGVWGGRRVGARSLGGFLLGKTEIQLSCLLHVISLLNLKHSKHTKNCGYKKVALILIFSIFQIKDGRWHQTHFVFHSLDPTLLPVVDIYNLPKASPGSHYHLEVSPVCFLWDCVFRAKTDGTRYIRIGGEWRNLPTNQTMSKPWPNTVQARRCHQPPNRSCFALPNSLDCKHRGRKHRDLGLEPGAKKGWERTGQFSHYNLLQALRKGSSHIRLLGENKGAMPQNLSRTFLSEGRQRPS